MDALTIIHVVETIQEAQKRIPDEFEVTFFSDYDLWMYHYVHDERVCPICEAHGDMVTIIGSKIRLLFPYLEIIDENRINVYEHPNCRCWLERVGFTEL